MTPDASRQSTSRFVLRAHLDADVLRALHEVSQKITFRGGESFVLTGDPAKTVLFLEYGRLMRRSAGFVLELVEPLSLVGETGGSPSPFIRGEALETSSVWVIPRAALDSVLKTRPLLSSRLEKIDEIMGQSTDLRAPAERVCA